jgi:hypothetical protein
VSLAERGRDAARAMPLRNPDQLATTQGEANEITRGTVELLERVEALEDQLRAIASVFGAETLLGDRPTDGRGLAYLRARLDLVDKGRWGEHGIDKFLEQQAEARRKPIFDPLEQEKARYTQLLYAEMRKLGAHLLTRGMGSGGRVVKVEWDPEPSDPDGRKRLAEAKRRVEAALAAEKNGAKK